MKYWNKLPKDKARREPENRDILTYYWDAYRWRSSGQDVQDWWCFFNTDSTEEKGFRKSIEDFLNIATTVASQNSRKNDTKGRGTAIFILIAPDYSNLDWWNRFRWLVVGFSFALGLVKILGKERMLTGICSIGKCSPKFYDLKIYGKMHVSCVKKAHMHHRHGTTQNLLLNVACRS